MPAWITEHTFEELVAAIVGSDDPVLYARACRALTTLLGADDDGDRWH